MNKKLREIIAFGITLGAITSVNLFTDNLSVYAKNKDADEISSLEVEESNGDDIDLYEDKDLDDEVEDDLEEGETYYGESDKQKITINTDDVDDEKVRIFFKNREYELDDRIPLSSGTNTIKVRVYEKKYDKHKKYSASDYNQYTLKIKYDDDDDDELDEVTIEDDNGKELTIYEDSEYKHSVSGDLDDDETYYVKTTTKSINIDNDDVDEDLVRVIKNGKVYEIGENISLSSGENTLKVRVYDDEDDDDDDYNTQYIFKVEYEKDDHTSKYYTNDNITNVHVGSPKTPDDDFLIVPSSSSINYGWKYNNGVWYYLEPNGSYARGWKLVGGSWYYMNEYGIMQTGWKLINGNWYYLENSGKMHTGWIKDNGSWYFLYTSGAMAKNIVIDGYRLGSNGAWIR